MLQPEVGQTVHVLVEPTALPEPAGDNCSLQGGRGIQYVVAPRSEQITSLFASLTETVGT